jgi:hypothetical protein
VKINRVVAILPFFWQMAASNRTNSFYRPSGDEIQDWQKGLERAGGF